MKPKSSWLLFKINSKRAHEEISVYINIKEKTSFFINDKSLTREGEPRLFVISGFLLLILKLCAGLCGLSSSFLCSLSHQALLSTWTMRLFLKYLKDQLKFYPKLSVYGQSCDSDSRVGADLSFTCFSKLLPLLHNPAWVADTAA